VAKKSFVANQKMQNKPNFFRLRPIHNLIEDKDIQQKMDNGHLAKTNPIKPTVSVAGLPLKYFEDRMRARNAANAQGVRSKQRITKMNNLAPPAKTKPILPRHLAKQIPRLKPKNGQIAKNLKKSQKLQIFSWKVLAKAF
jgi:hypothetical protein